MTRADSADKFGVFNPHRNQIRSVAASGQFNFWNFKRVASTAISRAMPMTLLRSGRFGVSLRIEHHIASATTQVFANGLRNQRTNGRMSKPST